MTTSSLLCPLPTSSLLCPLPTSSLLCPLPTSSLLCPLPTLSLLCLLVNNTDSTPFVLTDTLNASESTASDQYSQLMMSSLQNVTELGDSFITSFMKDFGGDIGFFGDSATEPLSHIDSGLSSTLPYFESTFQFSEFASPTTALEADTQISSSLDLHMLPPIINCVEGRIPLRDNSNENQTPVVMVNVCADEIKDVILVIYQPIVSQYFSALNINLVTDNVNTSITKSSPTSSNTFSSPSLTFTSRPTSLIKLNLLTRNMISHDTVLLRFQLPAQHVCKTTFKSMSN